MFESMVKGKNIRNKGKLALSKYFKKIGDGSRVAIIPDLGIRASFPKRLKGLSGDVIGSRGKFKIIKLKDGNKGKTFIIHPIHLRKL